MRFRFRSRVVVPLAGAFQCVIQLESSPARCSHVAGTELTRLVVIWSVDEHAIGVLLPFQAAVGGKTVVVLIGVQNRGPCYRKRRAERVQIAQVLAMLRELRSGHRVHRATGEMGSIERDVEGHLVGS